MTHQSSVVLARLADGGGDAVLHDALAVDAGAVGGLLDDHAGQHIEEALLHTGAGAHLDEEKGDVNIS